jgi:hypothetical protein
MGSTQVDLELCLSLMHEALADADAELITGLGNHREVTAARVWQGQVLVGWEPDEAAGGLLLRPPLLARLLALHATATLQGETLRVDAPGRIVAGLSPRHAELVQRMGGARRAALRVVLHFADGRYAGGEEVYSMVQHGQSAPVLRLSAQVRARSRPESPHTSHRAM